MDTDLQILSKLSKRILEKDRLCLFPECKQISINSHLLQRNGILNNITENGHVYQSRSKNWIKQHDDSFSDFELVGAKDAMTFLGFCSYHDDSFFKHIESGDKSFNDYKSHLLFSYRSLCNEFRKKEISAEIYENCLNSNRLKDVIPIDFLEKSIAGYKIGVENLNFYMNECLQEIEKPTNKFVFTQIECDKFDICASSVFSPMEVHELLGNEIMTIVAVHLIPSETKLKIIFGYHKDYSNKWTIDYIDSFKKMNRMELLSSLSDLITIRIETWAISKKVFKSISKDTMLKYRKYTKENSHDNSRSMSTNFNLFEFENLT